eukprot:6337681-Amphidinium_carterae.1
MADKKFERKADRITAVSRCNSASRALLRSYPDASESCLHLKANSWACSDKPYKGHETALLCNSPQCNQRS